MGYNGQPNTMKKIFSFLLATILTTNLIAQQQLATLNHNDTISVFYGASALQQAHDSASAGDVILLSSGVFNGIEISKAVTIKGNGIIRDTISDTQPTIVNGSSINVSGAVIEGISFHSLTYRYVYSGTINKCVIGNLGNMGPQCYLTNVAFINCIIRNFTGYNTNQTQFINSVVNFGGWNLSHACTLRNCVAKVSPGWLNVSYQNVSDFTCYNSILFYSNFSEGGNPIATYNCIGICHNDCSTDYFNFINEGNRNFSGLNTVFKDFDGDFSQGVDFDLQDSIATNVLGNDGTQVGIYGGMVPFNPRVFTPRFVRCNVAPHTTADGKLSVDVEVVSE